MGTKLYVHNAVTKQRATYNELGKCVLCCDYVNTDRVLVRVILVVNTSSAVANPRKILGDYKNNNSKFNDNIEINNLLIFYSSSSESMIFQRMSLAAFLGY